MPSPPGDLPDLGLNPRLIHLLHGRACSLPAVQLTWWCISTDPNLPIHPTPTSSLVSIYPLSTAKSLISALQVSSFASLF